MDNNMPSTKQVFDGYFASTKMKPETIRKSRPQVDRPELYRYEEKIGKQIFDMNEDELFEMVKSFGDNRRVTTDNEHFGISFASYGQISSMLRRIFSWYSDNVRLIRNPWNDPKMKGAVAATRLTEGKKPFTTETMNDIIQKVRDYYNEDRADHIELTILLFYCGFAEAQEIATMKERDIDFKHHTVSLSGRTVRLTDRCFELLVKIHNMETMDGWRGDFVMTSWHDSYFKLSVRPVEADGFNNRTLSQVSAQINQILLIMVKKNLNVNINYRVLYLLGFYDFLCKKEGKERVKEILTSIRVQEDVDAFINLANYYGMNVNAPTHLKRNLRMFIEGEDDIS